MNFLILKKCFNFLAYTKFVIIIKSKVVTLNNIILYDILETFENLSNYLSSISF